jgi:glycerophosphoryl diester phosphodiesterase
VTFVIAHRGSTIGARENTIPAFEAARLAGGDGVELDVHRTRDGQLAVHHDAEIPGIGRIEHLGAGDLPEWVPTLSEALDTCAGMEVIVEVKAETAAPLVAAEVTGRPATWVSSFNPSVLDAVGAADASIARAFLWVAAFDSDAALALASSLGCRAAHPHDNAVTPELVQAAHDRGMRVDTWTVNDPARVRQLASWGLDGIMTDDVAMAVAALH